MTFLKVLISLAWADGKISESEQNVIKSFYKKWNLGHDQIKQLKPYLRAPLPKEDEDKLVRQLIAEMSSPQDKKELIQALETMAQTDNKLDEEEKKFIQQVRVLLEETSFTKKTLGKIQNLFTRTMFKPVRERNPQLEKYFKNRILKDIHLNSEGTGHQISHGEDHIYFVCLVGTLLASVAFSDDHFSEVEKNALKTVLEKHFSFNGQDLEILFKVIQNQAQNGFDFHEVVTEFNRLASFDERVEFMDSFFEISAADGELSFEEVEEVRRITKAMRIPHKRFIESKMKYLNKVR